MVMHRERHITDLTLYHSQRERESFPVHITHMRHLSRTAHALQLPQPGTRHRASARSGGAAALSSSAGSTEHTPSQREARTAQLARVDDRPDPKRMRHCLTLTVSRSLSHEALSLMVKGMQGETGQHSATNMKQAASVKTPPK